MNNIVYIEREKIPDYDYPDEYNCYLRKECIGYQAWEYGIKGYISDTWDDLYLDNIRDNAIVCGMFICKDCIILVSHGGMDGDIQRYELLLDILTSPEYAGMPIYVQCCYPYQVSRLHPELKPYMLNSDHTRQCGIRMDNRNQYIELFTCVR